MGRKKPKDLFFMQQQQLFVSEIFKSIQGEGSKIGIPSIFLRLGICNLQCAWCDTPYTWKKGLTDYTARSQQWILKKIALLRKDTGIRNLVVTGGEPLLQLDKALVVALHDEGFEIGIETNGTLLPPPGIDWICVSPKADAEQKLKHGDELKLIYPQDGAAPERYAGQDFRNFFLQPMDGPDRVRNTEAPTRYCLEHPQWRLSLQTHKLIGIR